VCVCVCVCVGKSYSKSNLGPIVLEESGQLSNSHLNGDKTPIPNQTSGTPSLSESSKPTKFRFDSTSLPINRPIPHV